MNLDEILNLTESEGVLEDLESVDNKIDTEVEVEQGEPFFKQEMLDTIDEVDEYSWNRGEMGGLDWGFEGLNKAFEGLNQGVHLVAGPSNVGKFIF